jgi:glutamyl-tRNA reductase
MYVLLVGLNHRTAPIEVRECVAFSGESLDRAYRMLKNAPEIEGAVILATCNRTEVYATAKDVSRGIEFLEGFLAQFSGFAVDKLKKHLYQPNCYDAIMHLFRVAAGLDSMILGEAQILSQVKEAYQTAVQNGASDRVLNALFQKAINVGKKVRTDTAIDRHSLSVSYAAVELARSTLGELAGKTVLVLGAGEMSELTTRYLMANGVQTIIVSNRSYARADSLARELNGRAVHFDQLASTLYFIIPIFVSKNTIIGSSKTNPKGMVKASTKDTYWSTLNIVSRFSPAIKMKKLSTSFKTPK